MAKDKNRSRAEHQASLSTSGYRVPDSFYVDEVPKQESAEKESGDGGKAAADTDADGSEHGYKGELMTPEEHAELVRKQSGRSVDQLPANKSATPGTNVPDTNAPAADETDEEKSRRSAAKKSAK